MKQYILKLKTTSTTNYAVYDGTTALTDAELGTLFTTAGSAYFAFDFDSLTPSATDALTIVDSNDTAVITNTGLTDTIVETKDFKGTWSASATTFDTFTALGGVSMDEAQLSDLMGKIKNAGPAVVQTVGTSTTDVMSQDAATKMVYADADANNRRGICIPTIDGYNNRKTVSFRSIMMGSRSNSAHLGNHNVSIGYGCGPNNSTISGTVCIGDTAIVQSDSTVAIGGSAQVFGNSGASVAVGKDAAVKSSAPYATAIGATSECGYRGSVALGYSARNTRDFEVSIGNGSNQSAGHRYLANVKDPSLAQDAATKNYVDTNNADDALIGSVLSTPSSVAYVATANIQDDAVTADKIDFTEYSSSSETVVGRWVDGKPIYRKVYFFNAIASNTTQSIDISDLDIDVVVDLRGMVGYLSPTVSFRPLPLASGGSEDIRLDVTQGSLRMITYGTWSGFNRNFAVIDYTKTTD